MSFIKLVNESAKDTYISMLQDMLDDIKSPECYVADKMNDLGILDQFVDNRFRNSDQLLTYVKDMLSYGFEDFEDDEKEEMEEIYTDIKQSYKEVFDYLSFLQSGSKIKSILTKTISEIKKL
jgi:hypothetical protein